MTKTLKEYSKTLKDIKNLKAFVLETLKEKNPEAYENYIKEK